MEASSTDHVMFHAIAAVTFLGMLPASRPAIQSASRHPGSPHTHTPAGPRDAPKLWDGRGLNYGNLGKSSPGFQGGPFKPQKQRQPFRQDSGTSRGSSARTPGPRALCGFAHLPRQHQPYHALPVLEPSRTRVVNNVIAARAFESFPSCALLATTALPWLCIILLPRCGKRADRGVGSIPLAVPSAADGLGFEINPRFTCLFRTRTQARPISNALLFPR